MRMLLEYEEVGSSIWWKVENSQQDKNSQQKEQIHYKGHNFLAILREVMIQSKTSLEHQGKIHTIGPEFKKLLQQLDPSFVAEITKWIEHWHEKDSQQLQNELEKIRLTYLKDESDYKQNKDLEGYTPLHWAIMNRDKSLINTLIINSSDEELKASHSFPAFIMQKQRGNGLNVIKGELVEEKSYLYYLTEYLTTEQFKEIWDIHGSKLSPLMKLFPNNSLLDNACCKQNYALAHFLVSLGFKLSNKGRSFTYPSFSDSKQQIESINEFFSIFEKQSDKTPNFNDLQTCFEIIVGACSPTIFTQVVNHPYILANKNVIDDFIKTNARFTNNIYRFSDESMWEYFLTRHTPSSTDLATLISNTIWKDNLPLLLHLEQRFSLKIDNNTLLEATERQAASIIEYLIDKRKIDPCQPVGFNKKPPICYLPKGSTSDTVINAYFKAMGNEAFCNMMLGPHQPLKWISGDYGVMQGTLGVSRQHALPTMMATEIIKKCPSPIIRMQFDFGEQLATILDDKALFELMIVGYQHKENTHFITILDHIIQHKNELLIYDAHKEVLNLLIKKISVPQNKSLSEQGIEQVALIADQLNEANMQLNIAREIGSKYFQTEEQDAPTLDWLTREQFIKHPEDIKKINELRKKEKLRPLGEQLNRGRPDTLIDQSVIKEWYLPQKDIEITLEIKAKSSDSVVKPLILEPAVKKSIVPQCIVIEAIPDVLDTLEVVKPLVLEPVVEKLIVPKSIPEPRDTIKNEEKVNSTSVQIHSNNSSFFTKVKKVYDETPNSLNEKLGEAVSLLPLLPEENNAQKPNIFLYAINKIIEFLSDLIDSIAKLLNNLTHSQSVTP